jgi:hypothetical protein
MSTMELIGVGFRAARQARAQRRDLRAGTRTRGRLLTAVVEHGLAVAGLGCFTAAAAMVAAPLGLAVAGVSLFVLELRAGE